MRLVDPHVLDHTDTGGRDKPVLVLLPGGLTGWKMWEPLIPQLASQHRVVNVQLYANAQGLLGRTGDPDYSPDVERESVELTVREVVGDGPIHLAGWSNGGRAAIDFTLAYPERVRSLTVVEPAAWWLAATPDATTFDSFVRGIAGRDLSAEDVIQFLDAAGVGPPGADFTALPAWPVWYGARNALSWFPGSAITAMQRGLTGWEGISAPTLCVRGTETAPWLRAAVDALMAHLTNARLLELPGGHGCILANQAEFVTAVSEHIAAAP